MVLQLASEGELSLDDTVERHLPGVVEGNGNDGSVITVRDLLRHTSGIYDYNNDEDWDPFATIEIFEERRFEHYEPEDLVAVAMRHPPDFPAGTQRSYSNTNYIIAGMIIEAVTGNSWGQEVTDRIIEPLGLDGTTVPSGATMPDPHAKGYHQFEHGPLVDTTVLDPSAGGAGGAIISTPRDVTRFFMALLAGDLLTPEMFAEMQDTLPEGDGRYGLGLGWSPLSCGGGYWRHGGAVPGYASWEGFSQDGARGVVLSMNSLHSYGNPRRDADQADTAAELIDNALCDQ